MYILAKKGTTQVLTEARRVLSRNMYDIPNTDKIMIMIKL